MAFAAASGRVGLICLDGEDLTFWEMSYKASDDALEAYNYAMLMIQRHAPDWVVTERSDQAQYKGFKTKKLIDAMTKAAKDSDANSLAIERRQSFNNKYEEAAALVEKYPKLQAVKIKPRRFYEKEPRNTVIFEALALAESLKDGPVASLAAAMG